MNMHQPIDATTKRSATIASDQVKTLNLALQGGGAHGAFTWGVLDRCSTNLG
jgi:NTE family protein